MKKVKIIKLDKKDIQEMERQYANQLSSQENISNIKPFEEILEENINQTLAVLRLAKSRYEWKDPEEMIEFVDTLNDIKNSYVRGKCPDIKIFEDSQVKLVIKILESITSKLQGVDIEQFVKVLKEFKNAEDFKPEADK